MAQFARPSEDTVREDWVDEGDGTTTIFNSIDEAVANDADFIKSADAPTADVYVTKLSTVEDPLSSTGHVVRYRYQKSAAGGASVDLDVELREGYVNEGTPGTLIASDSHADIPNGWVDGSITLSAGEADSITDYSDLYLRFVADQPA